VDVVTVTKIFMVTVKKKIEVRTLVKAADEDEAKARAWAYVPDEVDGWHCDIHNGTTYRVEEWPCEL
jgi:hypothetical protein